VLLRPTSAGDTAAAVGEGRAGDRPPPTHPLHGSWSATRWQYTSRERPERVVDVVAGLGGTVTLSLSEGTYVLTWAIPGHGDASVGGTLTIDGARLVLDAAGTPAGSLLFHVSAATLALSSETSAWDFDGSGEEAAAFVAVLVRL